LAAESVSVPVPALVRPPLPEREEARATLLPLVSNVPPAAPSGARREEMSVVVPVAHCSPPPFSVMLPLPKLAVLLKLISPPVTVVAPV
jgi:hypothetical protein